MKSIAYRSTLQLAPLMLASFTLLPAYAAATDDTLDTVIVTGSRGSEARTVTSSPSPITITVLR